MAIADPIPGAPAPRRRPPDWRTDPEAPDWMRNRVKTFPVAPDFPTDVTLYQQMEARFRAAAAQVATYISQRTAKIVDAPEKLPLAGTLVAAQSMILTAVDPTATLVARAAAQLVLATTGDPLRPRLGAPQFPRPMSRALTPQQLLPGVDKVPDETAAVLLTNPRFVEAYMVGLNDEMRRELAWRQYPLDSRATFFANFWADAADIPPIATWNGANHLGANADAHDAQVVLLVRGELLRRYPNTLISAVKANNMGHLDGTTERFPVFRGAIDPDMTFFGFALTIHEAKADPWYFVLSEHPSEPRFGLDQRAAPQYLDWNDLAWTQLPPTSVVHNHVSVLSPPGPPPPASPKGATWATNSAQQAFIMFRQPVRLALRATALLGE
jgi:hypothetical protein